MDLIPLFDNVLYDNIITMVTINQNWNNSQATGGSNSPILNKVKISITVRQKASWFLMWVILPILVWTIVEIISNGLLCRVIDWGTK